MNFIFKTIGGLLIFCGCVVFSNSFAADISESFAIKGAGSVSCKRYITSVNNRSTEYTAFAGWIDGYNTAFNQFQTKTFDIAPWQSTILLTQALKRYCEKNPETQFFNAMRQMLKSLSGARLLQKSEVVEIKTGDKKLLIYKDIIKRVQGKLNKLNGSNLKVDGIFSKRTENELRKFQKQKNIRVSGIPGQITLQLLFF